MNERFRPAQSTGAGIDHDFQARIAHALEYIAAQLGEINERLADQAAAAQTEKTAKVQKGLGSATAKR